MSLIKPFRGLRPAPGRAAEVAAPPYDVLSADEARARVGNRPWSFLHISKAEIDLPPETDHYSPQVYAKSRENFDRMIAEGVFSVLGGRATIKAEEELALMGDKIELG